MTNPDIKKMPNSFGEEACAFIKANLEDTIKLMAEDDPSGINEKVLRLRFSGRCLSPIKTAKKLNISRYEVYSIEATAIRRIWRHTYGDERRHKAKSKTQNKKPEVEKLTEARKKHFRLPLQMKYVSEEYEIHVYKQKRSRSFNVTLIQKDDNMDWNKKKFRIIQGLNGCEGVVVRGLYENVAGDTHDELFQDEYVSFDGGEYGEQYGSWGAGNTCVYSGEITEEGVNKITNPTIVMNIDGEDGCREYHYILTLTDYQSFFLLYKKECDLE